MSVMKRGDGGVTKHRGRGGINRVGRCAREAGEPTPATITPTIGLVEVFEDSNLGR